MEIRLMTAGDVPIAMRLRELAGWNQTSRDWERFMHLEPEGCFVAAESEQVIGTATALSFGIRFGWVGMVLVDPAARGRGVGTALLLRAVEYLKERGVETVKLDATPAGHPVYLRQGFVDEYEIERWEGTASSACDSAASAMSAGDLEDALAVDREVFGADRGPLLRSIFGGAPRYSAIVRRPSGVQGYILGREGSLAHYLGPWVARPGDDAAELLFRTILGRCRGDRVFVDIPGGNSAARAAVEKAGFRLQRRLTRMYLGPNRHPGTPEMVCGIAGPELG